ncbi:MAG: hypothetical protein K0S22_1608 [Oscillospiraceae bacterium]|jgi:hypothetical protein|nr:hypothetical protein [Oscillospiraceae bacterium]
MKRLLGLSLAIIILTGCAGENSSDVLSSVNAADVSSVSNSMSQPVESEMGGPVKASQAFETAASSSSSDSGSEAVALKASTEKTPTTDGQALAQVTTAALADERFMSSKPATQSWPAAYESFYDAYPVLEQYKLERLGDLALRDQFAYTLWQISPTYISDIYCNLDKSPSPPANLFSKFFMRDQGDVGVLLNYAGTDNYFGEGIASLYPHPLLEQQGEKIAYINSPKRFDVGDYRYRSSLTMTAGVEAQLLAQKFSPESTVAYALTIDSYAYGVCFIDGDNISFWLGGKTLASHMPDELRSGVVYPFKIIAQDIHDRIDEIAPPKPMQMPGVPVANPACAKPVIYLYPEQPTNVAVTLGYPSEYLTYTYPMYQDGWRVRAEPNGTLTNLKDGSQHYYLFWEGDKKVDWNLSEGFVIKGSDTEAFLREKLAYMGLTPREYNDFITYWAPEMCRNPYNLISFSTEQYEALAPLSVTPVPDSILRVHMVYKSLKQPVKVLPQTLVPWQRTGFAMVEWGGSRA